MVLKNLKSYLKKLSKDGVALAFSGGVDSTFLLAVLAEMQKENPFKLTAMTMETILQTSEELKDARNIARDLSIKTKTFSFNPLSIKEVRCNRKERCYFCKKNIFSVFKEYAEENELKHIIDGTNADDLTAYRPGIKALKELGIKSPLAELKITKSEITRLSRELKLKTHDKPSMPCLATRFAYDTIIDAEKINQVIKAESFIKKLFPDIKNFRIRVHNALARLEVPKSFFPHVLKNFSAIANELKKIGFEYVTLDLEGFRTGSFDGKIFTEKTAVTENKEKMQ